MLFLSYAILAVLVVFLSVYLSKYVDFLDRKTKISGAFIGGVMLAGVTSLPELFTSITSVAINSPELVQGNVFGSNAFNLAILGICFITSAEKYKKALLSKSHISTVIVTLILFAVCLLGIKYEYCFEIGVINIEWSSAVIILFYAVNIRLMGDDEASGRETELSLSLGKIISGFVSFSVMLVIVSVMLTNVTDNIAEKYNLGTTAAGALFLGAATSLPELTSSINLVRMGNFNAAFGNIVGSNMFNFTILAFGDIIYKKGGVLAADGSPHIFIISAAAASFLAIISLYARKNKTCTVLIGMGIVFSYILSVILSV